MLYRQLGRTGYRVSQLGFGAMRLPMVGQGDEARVNRDLAIPMFHLAFEMGVNYVDTAVGYGNHDSQRAVGEAIKGRRDKLVVSTKNPYYDESEKEWWQNLEDSLQHLGVDYIDIYNHHGLRWKTYVEHIEPRVSKWMQKAKDQGLIRHICCSFHDDNEALINVVNSGYVDVITLQYNILHRVLEEGIAYAHQKGIGVVVMGPVGGGRLGADSKTLAEIIPGISRVPELALRFVLSNPSVSIALSGMSTMQQVEENLRVASDTVSLRDGDRAAIDEHLSRLKGLADLYCTGCEYCMPCPNEVGISGIFRAYNLARVYGLWDHSRKAYSRMQKNAGKPNRPRPADACTDCGACEPKCPQNIPIRKQLKEAHEALADKSTVAK